MSETDHEFRLLVEQKMRARAERNAQLRRDEQAAEEREAREARAAEAQAEQDRQARAERRQRRDAAAKARLNRPTLIAQYRAEPAGIRHVETLRQVCIQCGSERVGIKSGSVPRVLICKTCWTEWYMNGCWSCSAGRLDSRDPETPACEACGRIKCAVCGACDRNGCSTNPYSADHRHRDEEAV